MVIHLSLPEEENNTEYKKLYEVYDNVKRQFVNESMLEDYVINDDDFKGCGLMWCDMEGFTIDQYGDLYLNDECGNTMSINMARFSVVWNK